MSTRTTVHVMRHGEVYNPDGILYGRLDGYHLSERGHAQAEKVAEYLADRDIVLVVASPLQRAQETATPIAKRLDLPIETDEDLIESLNIFEGQRVSPGDGALRDPRNWRHLWNPLRPSWGEPYREIAARMRRAIDRAREGARGHEAVVVSHQLPVEILRRSLTGKRFAHDPRKRQCGLASLNSFVYDGGTLVDWYYREPAQQ
ncbi:histidine phosphatase family protein [Mycolicibacterium elephantis]